MPETLSFANASLTSSTLFGRMMLLINFIEFSSGAPPLRFVGASPSSSWSQQICARGRAADVHVRFLAVLRDVQTGAFVGLAGAQWNHGSDDLQQNETHHPAVGDGRRDCGGL